MFASAVVAAAVAQLLRWRGRLAAASGAGPSIWARRIGLAGAGAALLFIGVLVSLLAFVSDDFDPLARALNLASANSNALLVPVALAWLSACLAVPSMCLAAWAWKKRAWSGAGRAHYTLVELAGAAFVWFLVYWNFIGGRF